MSTVVHNLDEKRFEIEVNDHLAIAEYMETATNITFTHTEVPPELEGQGIGTKLAYTAVEYAYEKNLKMILICPFITQYVRNHPKYHPLVYGYKPKK